MRWRTLVLAASTLPALAACGDSTAPERGGAYTDEQIDYFAEIAFGSEFGGAEAVLHKWRGTVVVGTGGSPGAEDLRTLARVIREINGLAGEIELRRATARGDIRVHFAPESEFSAVLPDYVPTNYGFFWTWWDSAGEIERAVVLIATDEHLTQRERSHLIREELTQSLGLRRDSGRYPESIFYQDWTSTTEYAPIDRTLVEMLYRPELEPGMTREEALATLRSLEPVGAAIVRGTVTGAERP